MGIKVCKFGGTSLADASQMGKVRAIVQSDAERRYVVPSAPGKRSPDDQKITDLLYLCHEHARQGIAFDEVFALISDRYCQIISDLGLKLDLSPRLEQARKDIAAGASADYAASRGEYLNGPIIAALLDREFIDAAELIFFDEHGRFDAGKTQRTLAARLGEVEAAVIPGFYGSMPDGSIKTFSRGGSDVTGALVACGVGADVYENWTDVDGLLMADPRIVDNPKHIESLTYRELRELAYMGATVLHDEAIFPVRDANIPVNIRNTNAPDQPGTMIIANTESDTESDSLMQTHGITGIAGRKDFTVIAIEKALMNAEIGWARRVLSVLENHQVSFEHIPSGIDTMSLVIAARHLDGKLDDVLNDLRVECRPDRLAVYTDMAVIATVGRGMAHTPGMSAKLFGALGEAQVNVRMIDQGSSEINIIIGVESEDFEKAVCAIYQAFSS
jgi:aspartate kinase